MSTIVEDELITTLEQEFYLKRQLRVNLLCFKLKLMVTGMPAGTFSLSLMRGTTVLKTETFTSADLQTFMQTTDPYFYGLFPILFDGLTALAKGTYRLKLSASGYTPTETSHLGWIKDYENVYEEVEGGLPEYFTDYPLTYRMLEYKPRES